MPSIMYSNPEEPLTAEDVIESLGNGLLTMAFVNNIGADIFGTSVDLSNEQPAVRIEMTDGSEFEISVKKIK